MFSALLIDAKDSKVSGRGSYIRTGVVSNDLPRVSLALSRQLDGPGRRRSAPAPTRSYPAERDIEMVFVERGTFTMGCIPERDGTCSRSDSKPPHSITVSSFYIGKYSVTQAQWVAVMGSNPSANRNDNQQPVEMVSWDNAQEFITRLNSLTGKNYRLPTEAEWEYAARGGNKGNGYMYSGSNDLNEVGWYNINSSNQPHPVGQKKPNELGIYDMSGNVWDWCLDGYISNYYTTSPNTDPVASVSNKMYVFRGGQWGWLEEGCRVVFRNYSASNTQHPGIGFRVALSAQ
jgi:formylglycine-generating enzyme required for sulfatase activity